ncbi:hypothetical protein BC940DRAFT_262450 [Gongronella butleri]|nr:hypothetical protein BC940DRAFT_262450 [Gongronella butleri]
MSLSSHERLPMTPDSKLIKALISRLAYKLPFNSVNGTVQTLDVLERDPVVQQTVAAIIEIAKYKLSVVMHSLGNVLKNASNSAFYKPSSTFLPLEVLESQLFTLRLMAACLQHHAKSQQATAQQQQQQQRHVESLPRAYLDDALMQYLLTLLQPFLSNMHTLDEANDASSGGNGMTERALDSPNSPMSWKAMRTPEVIVELYQIAGRILHLVSASHWSLYYSRIKAVVQSMSTPMDNVDAKSPPELRLLEFVHLDKQKLQTILSEIGPGFLHMKSEGKVQFALYLHKAIWRWIDTYPAEFNSICTSETRVLSGSEILFDLCSSSADTLRKKASFWPLQTVLLILAPDLLLQAAFFDEPSSKNRRANFLSMLRQSLTSPRTAEAAVLCYVDLCKAAACVPPTDESVLRHIATDIENELHEKIWTLAQLTATDTLIPDQQRFLMEYLLIRLRLNSTDGVRHYINTLLDDMTPTSIKHALVKTCLTLAKESTSLPWHPDLSVVYPHVTLYLCKLFIDTTMVEMQTRYLLDGSSSSGARYRSMSAPIKSYEPAQVLLDLLELFKLSPPVIMTSQEEDGVEVIATVLVNMAALCQHRSTYMQQAASDCLIRLHQLDSASTWSPDAALPVSFWKISSRAVVTLARQALDPKQAEDTVNDQFVILSSLFEARNVFLTKYPEDASLAFDVKERYRASVAVEYACLIALCSSTPGVCGSALQCLKLLCRETAVIEEEEPHPSQMLTLRANLPVYRDMVDVRNSSLMIGRKVQQKHIHKYLRMLENPTPGIMAAWEEAWGRWQQLTQVIYRFGDDIPEDDHGPRRAVMGRHERVRAGTSNATKSTMPVPVSRLEVDDDKQTLWQNYTGFLASLGGACLKPMTSEESQIMSSNSISTSSSQPSAKSEPLNMIEKYIHDMLQLLTVDNVIIREAAKDALGHDLAPPLYAVFSRHLEALVSRNFTANGEPVCSPSRSLLVEQSMAILRLILDRLAPGNPHFLINIDFGGLVSHFNTYIGGLTPSYETTRMQINFCYLVEAMVIKKDQIIIGNENQLRNRLLETMMQWTSFFKPTTTNSTSPTAILSKQLPSPEDKIYRDLDHLCIKTMVAVSHQLPLQIGATTKDEDSKMLKSRLYTKYFYFVTKVLNRCHQDERPVPRNVTKSAQDPTMDYQMVEPHHDMLMLKENAILVMSNLLSANVDIGLKHTLSLGAYHEDPLIRTAFMQVLTNILCQGTEFDSLDENVKMSRYEKLVDLLFESDMDITLSLCQVCTGSDVERIARVLVQCFNAKNLMKELLTHVITKEVKATDVEGELFRKTSMATQLLSSTAMMMCTDYVRDTLYPALVAVNALPEERLTWELSPQKLTSEESLGANRRNVLAVADLLLKAICSSASRAPAAFREHLCVLSEAVRVKFPESKYTAVGGFVFLRLFCVATLTPDKFGFSNDAIPKNRNARKVILQANRVIQNLSSNVLFGSKDAHLVSLNDFLTENIYKVTTFLREISASPSAAASRNSPDVITPSPSTSSLTSKSGTVGGAALGTPGMAIDRMHVMNIRTFEMLHVILYENLDRITRDLSRRRTRNLNGNQQQQTPTSAGPLSSIKMTKVPTASSASSSSTPSSPSPTPFATTTLTGNTNVVIPSSSSPALSTSPMAADANALRYVPNAIPWKQTLDKLNKLLGELGQPAALTAEDSSYVTTNAVVKNSHDYSEFMARHRHRDTAAIRALNAFYQAGTSRQSYPVFYLIAAKITTQDVDFELFVYHMLKVIEPALNKPFELVFDTTRMNPQNEIPVHWIITFFQLIFQELKEYLVHLYIFNPNSHLQRYIRKIPLKITNRLLKKTQFAISSAHMHEFIAPSELQLPKATMDLEKELCTAFQPVSKILTMNMRIPVMVKVGEEHLQVITLREQEIFFSLNTKLNDVFHLSDIAEVYSLPSASNPGGGELVVKHDGGRSLTAFSTPKRDAFVELFKQNKKRYETSVSDTPFDRVIRPNDVPGRLLNMALMNLGDDDPHLRLASYNLLDSLSTYFRFDMSSKLLQANGLCIPENNTDFIVSISKSVAKTEPHLTFEFIQECVDGFRRSNLKTRLLCLDYLSPWLKNLGLYTRSADRERGLGKILSILRLLIDITLDSSKEYKHVQTRVWGTIARVDELINPVLDVFTKVSVENGVGSLEAETLGETLVTMGNIPIRAKIINRLRRAIQRSSIRPTTKLPDSHVWAEVAILLRFALVLSFTVAQNDRHINNMAEMCHVMTLLVATGTPLICTTVHELVANVLHNLCSDRSLPEDNRKRLLFIFNNICDGEIRHHFGLLKTKSNAYAKESTTAMSWDTVNLTSLEVVTRVLLEVQVISAPDVHTLNAWRARWMGLVTSTAFQFNPAIQPRSFVVLGCLAQDEVDDDLMYQILVAMRGALAIFSDSDASLITSIMMCLTNVIDSLPRSSQYLLPMFWLAISLVQMGHAAIFSEAIRFLHAVIRALDAHHLFDEQPMVKVLLEARRPFETISAELDRICGVSFTTHFSFALTTLLLKGAKSAEPRTLVRDVLTTFLTIDAKHSTPAPPPPAASAVHRRPSLAGTHHQANGSPSGGQPQPHRSNYTPASKASRNVSQRPIAHANPAAITSSVTISTISSMTSGHSASMVLTTMMEQTNNTVDARFLGYLIGLLPFFAQDASSRELLDLIGINDVDVDHSNAYVRLFDALDIPNNTTALLMVSMLLLLLNSAETDAERTFLYSFMSEAAVAVPEVFSLIYEALLVKMNQVIVSSQSQAVLDAVKQLLLNACAEPIISHHGNRRSQKSYLDELGFAALTDVPQGATQQQQQHQFINPEMVYQLLDRITV